MLSSSRLSSVTTLKAQCQAKTEAVLLSHDAANATKQQLFQLKVASSKLKVDVKQLERDIVRKRENCHSLKEEVSALQIQNEDLIASTSVTQVSINEAQRNISSKQAELKLMSNDSSSKLTQLGIKTRPNQPLKSVLKAIEQISKKVSCAIVNIIANRYLLNVSSDRLHRIFAKKEKWMCYRSSRRLKTAESRYHYFLYLCSCNFNIDNLCCSWRNGTRC